MKKVLLAVAIATLATSAMAVDIGAAAGAGTVGFASVNSSHSAVSGVYASSLVGPGFQVNSYTAGNQSMSNTGARFNNTQGANAYVSVTNTSAGPGNSSVTVASGHDQFQSQGIAVGNSTASENYGSESLAQGGLAANVSLTNASGSADSLTGSVGALTGFGIGFGAHP